MKKKFTEQNSENLEDSKWQGHMGVRIFVVYAAYAPKLLVIKAKQTMQAALS
jgi:hypothetical protein